jgi:hypothetical protein
MTDAKDAAASAHQALMRVLSVAPHRLNVPWAMLRNGTVDTLMQAMALPTGGRTFRHRLSALHLQKGHG